MQLHRGISITTLTVQGDAVTLRVTHRLQGQQEASRSVWIPLQLDPNVPIVDSLTVCKLQSACACLSAHR